MHAPAGPFDTSSDMHMRAVLNVGVRGISAILHGVRGRSSCIWQSISISVYTVLAQQLVQLCVPCAAPRDVATSSCSELMVQEQDRQGSVRSIQPSYLFTSLVSITWHREAGRSCMQRRIRHDRAMHARLQRTHVAGALSHEDSCLDSPAATACVQNVRGVLKCVRSRQLSVALFCLH